MVINALTMLNDLRFNIGSLKRSALLNIIRMHLDKILDASPVIAETTNYRYSRIDFVTSDQLRAPKGNEKKLVIDAKKFEHEEDLCDAVMIVKVYKLGWKRLIVYKYRGQLFTCAASARLQKMSELIFTGLPETTSPPVLTGMEIYVYGNFQDQLCQIMKEGKLVLFGDVG
jgi:hypothetical protein